MMTGVKAVTDLRHGDVRVIGLPDGQLNEAEVTLPTYQALCVNGMMPEFWLFIEARPAGVHTLPIAAFEPEAVEDTRNAINLLAPDQSGDGCSLPGCQQDVSDRSRGFPLCTIHASHMSDWDDLIAS